MTQYLIYLLIVKIAMIKIINSNKFDMLNLLIDNITIDSSIQNIFNLKFNIF